MEQISWDHLDDRTAVEDRSTQINRYTDAVAMVLAVGNIYYS